MNSRDLPAWLRELYPFEPKRFETGSGQMSYLDEGQGDEAVLMEPIEYAEGVGVDLLAGKRVLPPRHYDRQTHEDEL